ncbi:uncharacterized protein LAESUDRAFT_720223 [Laetiporus sulphureus 93-53]|uniref:Protein ROT1 n=1 Tax=Laetiporus sulphureus 93-53 TaxID=1314785 RepID=A0A165HW75_9APHY|nr:uncharacterized protein LAESUDRAFT_720223 [Laetiporus sulphureus 93-53]KZT12271.1 hypothetical protein LAESUDRAFT_720223 [Laetiporus sulphureus 93-53]
MLGRLFSLLAVATASVLAQDIVFDSAHNATVIYGTWSSGSMGVVTGSGFADPAKESFTYPNTTGISYSFTEDGYYEIARYRYNSNGSQPSCITGVMNWVHGTYDLLSNGSIVTYPFGDGYQQIQDGCAATTDFIEDYNDTELYQSWEIFLDSTLGYQLQLYQYDGSPLAQQNLYSTTPNMLPTRSLRNTTTSASSELVINARSELATSAGARTQGWSAATTVAIAAGLASLVL